MKNMLNSPLHPQKLCFCDRLIDEEPSGDDTESDSDESDEDDDATTIRLRKVGENTPDTHYVFTCHSLCIHLPLTMYPPATHYVFTCYSLCTHLSLTMYSPVTHYVLTCHSLCTHKSFTTLQPSNLSKCINFIPLSMPLLRRLLCSFHINF